MGKTSDMRHSFQDIEKYRWNDERFQEQKVGDKCGLWLIPSQYSRFFLSVISDDGIKTGWEHVSFKLVRKSRKRLMVVERTPTWSEVCEVKDIFWQEDECVMQIHPPKQFYVNTHPYVLHLWKPLHENIPQPHWSMV